MKKELKNNGAITNQRNKKKIIGDLVWYIVRAPTSTLVVQWINNFDESIIKISYIPKLVEKWNCKRDSNNKFKGSIVIIIIW